MSDWITSEIRQAFLSKHLALWLGPSYGLNPNQPLQARAVNEDDRQLARIPWQRVFSDSPVTVFEQAVRDMQQEAPVEGVTSPRIPLAISRPGQDEQIDLTQFLPVYYLKGWLDARNREDAYGKLGATLRNAYRSSLLLGLRDIPVQGGVVILVGFESEQLQETIQEARDFLGPLVPILCLTTTPFPTDDRAISCVTDTISGFCDALRDGGLISEAGQAEAAHVFAGPLKVRIDDILQTPTGRLDNFFRVVTAEAIIPAPKVDRELFDAFMVSNEREDASSVRSDRKEWMGFASGLFIERDYRVESKPLDQYVLGRLRDLAASKQSPIRNETINLPTHSGAGATTLLHSVAFTCATEGFPCFVLKQDATELPIGQLSVALTGLSRRVGQQSKERHDNGRGTAPDAVTREAPPVLLIFDTQHADIDEVLGAAQTLGASGRRCIVLRAYLSEDREVGLEAQEDVRLDVKRVRGKTQKLDLLKATLTDHETDAVQAHFDRLRREGGLPLLERTTTDWRHFQKESAFRIVSNNTTEPAESLFWVALHYFVVTNDPDWETGNITTALFKRLHSLSKDDPLCIKTLLDICRFSVNHLYVDWRLLGRLEGNSYSMDIVARTNKLDEQHLVHFRYEDYTGSNLYRMRHWLYAKLFLQMDDDNRAKLIAAGVPKPAIPTAQDLNRPQWMLVPFLETLDGSVDGDVRLAEEISSQALRITTERVQNWGARNDILEAFKKIHPVIHGASRVINHHHAMALWKTAAYDPHLDEPTKSSRFSQAVGLLKDALRIPGRHGERDEHPGHILTSQAYALWHWAQMCSELKDRIQHEAMAIAKFREALEQLPDSRHTAYGLAQVLTSVCERKASSAITDDVAAMLGEAINLLQEEPDPDFAVPWCALRARVVGLLDQAAPAEYREQLRNADKEAGYLLEAWACLKGDVSKAEAEAAREALHYLEAAIGNPSVECTWRSYYLLYRLLLASPVPIKTLRRRYELLRRLERLPDFRLKPAELFDLAVLCYQFDQFEDGALIFRDLRISGKSKQLNAIEHPFWIAPDSPGRPRSATLKVTRTDSPYRGWGEVLEIGQEIIFSPVHFDPDGNKLPIGHSVPCYIRLSPTGAKAVPLSFFHGSQSR